MGFKEIFFIIQIFTTVLLAQPKMSVIVEETEDRWIQFSDGRKLRHGMEVSHLLNQKLFESNKFRLKIKLNSEPGIGVFSTNTNPRLMEELKKRLPNSEFNYLESDKVVRAQNVGEAHIVIRPKVTTLLYASGEKANRIVYGFSPDRLNPYNEGKEGSAENDFIATRYSNVNQCKELDYFYGQLNPTGKGHNRSNFGANADEGVGFSLFGFGFKFRKKQFQVKMGIEMDVMIAHRAFRKTYKYDFKAKGKDVLVDLMFNGVNVGYETKRRFTLRQAIDEALPQLMDEVIKDLPKFSWQSQLIADNSGSWYIQGGFLDGVQKGQKFISAEGNLYQVKEVFESVSKVVYPLSNNSLPYHGESVRFWNNEKESPWSVSLLANTNSVEQFNISKQLFNTTNPQTASQANGNCRGRKLGFFEKLIVNMMSFYGQWRFNNIYDSNFDNKQKANYSQNIPKVAIVSTGIYPREASIHNKIEASGFDFISWDQRPSDAIGSGTAAAIYLNKLLKKENYKIIPIRVIGPSGETHSSAIYSAFEWLSKRDDIDVVAVPFYPNLKSQAYIDGIKLLVRSGKEVVVPMASGIYGPHLAASKKSFKTNGMRGRVSLSSQGVGVMELTSRILKKKFN